MYFDPKIRNIRVNSMKKNYIIYFFLMIIVIVGIIFGINFIGSYKNRKKTNEFNVIDIECKQSNCNNTTSNSISNHNISSNSNVNSNKVSNDNSNKGTSNIVSNSNNGNKDVKPAHEVTSNNSNETSTSNIDEHVDISDSNIKWKQGTILKIFDVEKIAPGDNGVYEFKVNNNTKYNVSYNIRFEENNKYHANVMYKLKRNGNYVVGNEETWKYYDKLNIENDKLTKGLKDEYILYWKWVDSSNDTAVGVAAQNNPDATYSLKIYTEATEYESEVKDASENPNTYDNILLYYISFISSCLFIILLLIIRRKKINE